MDKEIYQEDRGPQERQAARGGSARLRGANDKVNKVGRGAPSQLPGWGTITDSLVESLWEVGEENGRDRETTEVGGSRPG